MSFPRYSGYKDSEVEWLGEVPEHWDIRRVRRIFVIKKRIAGELGFDILSITQQGIKVRDPESNDGQVSMDYSKYQVVEPGDFAMNHMDLLTGYVDISRRLGVTSPDYRVFSIAEHCISDPGYLLYIFQMGYRQKILYAYGQGSSQLGRWRLPTEEFKDWAIPFPSLIEQASIATFLDRETAKIDALIAEQQSLIELLQEKRQVVISHAVTKGLNSNAAMKDSGVEWLGEVPEHWTVNKIGRELLQAPCYGVLVPEYTDDGIPMIRINDLGDGAISPEARRIKSSQSQEYSRTLIEAGDVLIGVVGTIGRPVVVDSRHEGWNLSRAVARLVTRKDSLLPGFLALALESSILSHYKDLVCTGSAQIVLNMQDLSALKIAVPPISEQEDLVRLTTHRIKEIKESARMASATIDLLSKRRSALISAAVTGQIDVRGLVEEVAA